MKYRKKPVIIEAKQWNGHGDHEQVAQSAQQSVNGSECNLCHKIYKDHGWIETLEGGHIVCPNDFVITGVQGEHYPCKPDIFAATYEKVEESVGV